MKLVSYTYDNQDKIGAVQDGMVFDLTSIAPTMIDFIESGSDALARVRAFIDSASSSLPLNDVQLQAPIPNPRRNIMCLGLNYAEHAQEHYTSSGRKTELPDFPIIFTKATTAINAPYADIPYDPAVTAELDWEVELAVVISREGKNISADQAEKYVFGYAVINDVSARDLQRQHKQYFKGKSLDGACPMGPWIITADELSDPHNLRVTSRVNGEVKQDSNTSLMIFKVPAIIYHLSRGMTLLSGDIIATGTPSGVGFARTPPEFLQVGDVIECEIEDVGAIKNRIAST